MFHLLRGRRQLDARIAELHQPQYIFDPAGGTVTVACPPPGCGHAIEGCTDMPHAEQQHLVYARHVEAGHVRRGHYVPDVLRRSVQSVPRQFSPHARFIR